MSSLPIEQVALRLHPDDHVVVARRDLAAGEQVRLGDGTVLSLAGSVPRGHKLAVAAVPAGGLVLKYGQIIGFATTSIAPGEHVHEHNLTFGSGELSLDYQPGAEVRPVDLLPPAERGVFHGYVRPDGRVGTRNYLAVVSTANCSASVAQAIARRFDGVRERFAHVDGVIPVVHKGGCGGKPGWELRLLQRTLAGLACHPNVGGYLVVGLGCEGNQVSDFIETGDLVQIQLPGRERPAALLMQELGGTAATVEAGVREVERLLPRLDAMRREPVTADRLTVALQCGGSDALSGITANPAVGAMADELVRHGGTAVLGETPEIYGAEHLLTRRAVAPEVAAKLLERIAWWKDYTARHDFTIDNNPAPGNKHGGLTTIFEKSLGAVAKAGTTPLCRVVEYAEPAVGPGLVHMDTPGYDPVSVTGQVAGGCTLVVFTTGRGSCFGFKPSPVIKVASNTPLFQRMGPDMDLNAGVIFDGGASVAEVGQQLFRLLLAVASGELTRSEALAVGTEEFNPWLLGCTM